MGTRKGPPGTGISTAPANTRLLVQPARHAGAQWPAQWKRPQPEGWRDVLDPVIARYAGRDLGGRFLRADAGYTITAIYKRLHDSTRRPREKSVITSKVRRSCSQTAVHLGSVGRGGIP